MVERSRVSSFRTPAALLENALTCIGLALEREGSEIELRTRATAFRARLEASRDEAAPFAHALAAWRLDETASWILAAALAYELVPGMPVPTVATCARIAARLAGASLFEAEATVLGRLVQLALVTVGPGSEPLHARSIRVQPRILELALGAEAAPPVTIARTAEVAVAACDAARVERITAAIDAGVHVLGDRTWIPAIIAVALDYGYPTVIADGVDPAVAVREALLADGPLVVASSPHHPAWQLHARGVLVLT